MVVRVFCALVLIFMGSSVLAQGPSGYDITRENLPATPLIYAAYGFVWSALAVYIFILWRRLGRVERELADVTAKLASRR